MAQLSRRSSAKLRLENLEDRTVPAGSVVRWNTVALDATAADHALGGPAHQFGPTRASRALAIVQAAVYDSVNSIARQYVPYKFQVVAVPGASIDAAVAQAAHDTLSALYPSFQAIFDADLAQDLSAIPTAAAQSGAAVGHQVAMLMLADRGNDGSDLNPTYTFINQPGYWQVDPYHPTQQPLSVGWGAVTPFTMTSGSQFLAPPPPTLNSPEYTAAYNEVMAYGGDGTTTPTIRSQEQTEIGIYWGYDGQPGLCSPPRLYNQIAQTIAAQMGNTNVQDARFFALINLAIADAAIASWGTKYEYSVWRPVTAIQNGNTDGNPNTTGNATWHPLGAPADNGGGSNFTPPFPSYTSGHATLGGAFFRMMANFYGTDQIPFTFISDEFNGLTFDMNGEVRPVRPRHFETFSQAAEENGQSRIYLGIHFAFDKTAGIDQGTAIADYAFGHYLRARPAIQRTVFGADAGGGPHVRVTDTATGQVVFDFFAYDPKFTGGVRVALGDVNADGAADIITAAGPGGGPHVKVFDGITGALIREFFAYDAEFNGGVFVAAGDVNGDGAADIITGADAGGGPHVKAFDGVSGNLLNQFFAYDAAFTGGVRVAAGDIDGDGVAEIITGAGAGGGPHVKVLTGLTAVPIVEYYAYDRTFRGGVYVAAGDCSGDGLDDVITGAGAGGGPHIKVIDGAGRVLQSFFANLPAGHNQRSPLAMMPDAQLNSCGVRVGCADVNGDGRDDILFAAGPGTPPIVEADDAVSRDVLSRSFGYDPTFLGGVNISGVG